MELTFLMRHRLDMRFKHLFKACWDRPVSRLRSFTQMAMSCARSMCWSTCRSSRLGRVGKGGDTM